MLDVNKILDPNINFEFREVSYILKDNMAKPDSKLKIRDSIAIEKCSEDELIFTLTRNLSFLPASIFDIKVCVGVYRRRANDCTEKLNSIVNEDYIRTYLQEFTGPLMSQISQLISAITMATSRTPLITAPIFTDIISV